MKVALCLCGLAGGRNFKANEYAPQGAPVSWEKAFDHFDRHILSKNDVDVFIHAWNPELEDELTKAFDPRRAEFEPPRLFAPNLKGRKDRKTGTEVTKKQIVYSRWYSSKRVLELCAETHRELFSKYDMVMVSRFDVAWRVDVDFSQFDPSMFWASHWCTYQVKQPDGSLKNIWREHHSGGWDGHPDVIHEHRGWPKTNQGLQDFWFFSGPNNMFQFATLYDALPQINRGRARNSPHKLAVEHLVRMGMVNRIRFAFHNFEDFTLVRRLYDHVGC